MLTNLKRIDIIVLSEISFDRYFGVKGNANCLKLLKEGVFENEKSNVKNVNQG